MSTKHIVLIILLTVMVHIHISAQENTQVGLPEGAIARLGKGGINLMRFSPDGTQLAVGTDIGLWVYDVNNRSESFLFSGNAKQVNVIAFSTDGNMLAGGGFQNPIIQVWNPHTEDKLSSFNLPNDNVSFQGIAFYDRSMITISGSGDMISFNPENGGKLSEIRFGSMYDLVVFSHDGRTLAGVDRIGEIHLRDSMTGKPKGLLIGHEDIKKRDIYSLAFSPDGKILASGSEDMTVILWDTEKKNKITTLDGHKGWVTAVAFSEDGKTLASGDAAKEIILWDLDSLKKRASITGHQNTINSLTFAPSTTPKYGQCLASGSADGTIRFWNPTDGEELTTYATGFTEMVKMVAFSIESTLASVAFNGIVDLWNLRSLDIQTTYSDGKCDYLASSALSLDSTLFAGRRMNCLVRFNPYDGGYRISNSTEKKISIWNFPSGEDITDLFKVGKNVGANMTEFAPNQSIIAIQKFDSITGYHVYTGTELFHLKTVGTISSSQMVFSPDGKWIAIGGTFVNIHVWNVESPDEPPIISTKKPIAIAFSPDGTSLALLVREGLAIWNFSTDSQDVRTLINENLEGMDWILKYSPDGTMLIGSSTSIDNTIKIWDVQTGKVLGNLSCHTEPITTLQFSHNGKTFASGSQDGTILLWDWEQITKKLLTKRTDENLTKNLIPPKAPKQ